MMNTIQWLHLNGVDYTILAILFISFLIGIFRGFVCELISLITWVGAFLIAFKFANPAANYLIHIIDSLTVRYVIAFTLIFVVILIIGISINLLIRHLWYRTGVPIIDRILGMLFGIARGILIVAFILLFVRASALQDEPVVKHSQLIPVFVPVINWFHQVLPEKIVHISEWSHPNKTEINKSSTTSQAQTPGKTLKK